MAASATITRQEAARELLARREASRSLLGFTTYTFPGFEVGEHHKKICEHLDAVERGEIKRLMIEAPPRHTKSELAAKRFPAYYLGKHKSRQIITATYGAELSKDIGGDVRDIIRDRRYQNIFPDTDIRPDKKAAGRWNTTNGGIYIATGIGGGITGRGAHVLVVDDPFKSREEADSKKKRDRVWKWFSSTARTRLMPGAAIVVINTRWHEDDLSGRLLERQKKGGAQWVVLKLEAVANEDTENETALWPAWFPLEELRSIKKEILARDWNALFQQRPTTEEGTYYKREWFQFYEKIPENLHKYAVSDFAVTDEERAKEENEAADPDYTEHGIVGVDPHRDLYILDWWWGREDPHSWIVPWIRMLRQWEPFTFFGESGVIRRAMEGTLKTTMEEHNTYVRIEWLPSLSDKAARGRAFQTRCSQRKVYLPANKPWAQRVVNELVAFPGAKHDDVHDALSLIGRALDMAHPGIAPQQEQEQKRDRWQEAFRRARLGVSGSDDWKVK